jgi:hypothetical protein
MIGELLLMRIGCYAYNIFIVTITMAIILSCRKVHQVLQYEMSIREANYQLIADNDKHQEEVNVTTDSLKSSRSVSPVRIEDVINLVNRKQAALNIRNNLSSLSPKRTRTPRDDPSKSPISSPTPLDNDRVSKKPVMKHHLDKDIDTSPRSISPVQMRILTLHDLAGKKQIFSPDKKLSRLRSVSPKRATNNSTLGNVKVIHSPNSSIIISKDEESNELNGGSSSYGTF